MEKKYEDDYEVCDCKGITYGEIKTAILDHNLKTVKEIGEWTYAGTACGSCVCQEDDIMDEKELFLVNILNMESN